MRGHRDPARQARRWEAQAAAWRCPNDCGHGVEAHREYQSTWRRDGDDLVQVRHPRYQPGLFACDADGCTCEIATMVAAVSS